MTLAFTVAGRPQPKGSTRAIPYQRLGEARLRVRVTSDNRQVKPWQASVALAAQLAIRTARPAIVTPAGGPMRLAAVFQFARPQRLSARRAVPAHVVKPDLDKLLRGLCDALTGVVWFDDAQVVEITATKTYARALADQGVRVTVHLAGPDPAPED